MYSFYKNVLSSKNKRKNADTKILFIHNKMDGFKLKNPPDKSPLTISSLGLLK